MNCSFQKCAALLSAVALSGFLACSAHAENKLFPTDILDKGQMDVRITLEGGRSKASIADGPFLGTSTVRSRELSLAVRYGLGSNWHVGAQLDSGQIRARTKYDLATVATDTNTSGILGGSLWAKYGFIADKSSPLTLSGELGVASYSSKNPSDASANATYAAVAMGWKFSESAKFHATASLDFPDSSEYAKSAHLGAGVWVAVNDKITINPYVGLARFNAHRSEPVLNSVHMGVSGVVSVGRNTYLVPTLGFTKYSSLNHANGVHQNASLSRGIGITLSHLF